MKKKYVRFHCRGCVGALVVLIVIAGYVALTLGNFFIS